MDRKKLEKLAWQKTHRDFRAAWNRGDTRLLKLVDGQGTCCVHISQWTEAELRARAGLR